MCMNTDIVRMWCAGPTVTLVGLISSVQTAEFSCGCMSCLGTTGSKEDAASKVLYRRTELIKCVRVEGIFSLFPVSLRFVFVCVRSSVCACFSSVAPVR